MGQAYKEQEHVAKGGKKHRDKVKGKRHRSKGAMGKGRREMDKGTKTKDNVNKD